MSRADDMRLGSLIQPGADGTVVLIGFPYDEGCKRNGGRVGAAKAPEAFRSFLQKMGPVVNAELDIDLSTALPRGVSDAGDVPQGLPLEEAHSKLQTMVAEVLARGGIPFIIGGSNDQSSPNGMALLDHVAATNGGSDATLGAAEIAPVSIVNIDAHLDVRPRLLSPEDEARLAANPNDPKKGSIPHSGSPFRDLLEDPRFHGQSFLEFAAQGDQCSRAHVAYVEAKGGQVQWMGKLREKEAEMQVPVVQAFSKWLAQECARRSTQNIFVSFDIDSVDSRDCPGVSCGASYGLTSAEALGIGFEAGKCPQVAMMDLSELNPVIEGYRSPRLCVLVFYRFLLGVALRGLKK